MDIVGRRDIANAMSLTMVVMNVTRVIGPVSGGALIAFLGPAICFGIAAGLAVMAMIAILPLGLPARIELTGPASVLHELTQGFKFIVHNRNMLAVWLITLVANLFVWPAYASFMPVFAKDNLGLDALGLGILASGFGIGALVGSLFIASLGDLKRKGLLYEVGTLLFALFFGFFVLSRWFPLAFSLVLLAGLASSAFGTMQSTLTLILAPEEMRGRSMGFLMLGIAGMSIGSLLLGVAANAIGASMATAISCSLLILSALAIIFWAPSLRRL
jgi:predicted MFS family arabinose efflux permease